MLLTALTVLHVIVCVFLIIVVLLQHGKSADIAGAFGGMGSQTAFGPRGAATLFSKLTAIAVVIFMITSLTLTIMNKRTGPGGSVMEGVQSQPQQSQPAPQTPPPTQSK